MAAPDSENSDEVAAGYLRSGFNQRLGFGESPALLVVDVCRAYFDPDSPLCLPEDSSLVGCRALVEASRGAGVPVLWSRVEYEPGGADGGIFYRKVAALSVFDRGGEYGAWVDGVEPAADETVITKQQASSFHDTDLHQLLSNRGIDTLLICGVSTSGCVRATALDACQYNYIPVVVDEACGDRSPELHANTLFDLDAKYADVESLAVVLDHLDHLDRLHPG